MLLLRHQRLEAPVRRNNRKPMDNLRVPGMPAVPAVGATILRTWQIRFSVYLNEGCKLKLSDRESIKRNVPCDVNFRMRIK
jgi:hypothetical protein